MSSFSIPKIFTLPGRLSAPGDYALCSVSLSMMLRVRYLAFVYCNEKWRARPGNDRFHLHQL